MVATDGHRLAMVEKQIRAAGSDSSFPRLAAEKGDERDPEAGQRRCEQED